MKTAGEGAAATRLQKIQTFPPLFQTYCHYPQKQLALSTDFFIKVKFAGSLLIKVFLGHSVSHAVQHRQHSTKRDVNLHVVKECLKNADIIRLKPANTNRDLQNIRKLLSRRQHEQRP